MLQGVSPCNIQLQYKCWVNRWVNNTGNRAGANMAGKTKELSALEVKRLTSSGFYSVGGATGLYLSIARGGSKSWILRATVAGKRRDIGLGGFTDVSLARAREKAKEYREMISDGIDPVVERKQAREQLRAKHAKRITFAESAKRCYAIKKPEFRNVKHSNDWINSLQRHAFDLIGDMQVSDIEMPHVLQVLERIWYTKTETATRVRQRIEAVLSWAKVSGYRTGENPARWEENLKETLSAPSKIAPVKHFAALPRQQIGQFMADLRKKDGISIRALEFTILCAARTGEVRGATWAEIDFDEKLWTIPGERMKAGKAHKIPLSDRAIGVLETISRFVGSDFVFTSPRGNQLSNMALLQVCRRMEVDAVPHGFRSTFKDWARTSTAYPDEVSELALAHVNSDATRSAYARDELLPKRSRLMAEWAKFCNTTSSNGEVVPSREQA